MTGISYINEHDDLIRDSKLKITFPSVNYNTEEARQLFLGSIAQGFTSMANLSENVHSLKSYAYPEGECGYGGCVPQPPKNANFSVGPGELNAVLTEQTDKTNRGMLSQNIRAAFEIESSSSEEFNCTNVGAIFAGVADIADKLGPGFSWLAMTSVIQDPSFVWVNNVGVHLSCYLH